MGLGRRCRGLLASWGGGRSQLKWKDGGVFWGQGRAGGVTYSARSLITQSVLSFASFAMTMTLSPVAPAGWGVYLTVP